MKESTSLCVITQATFLPWLGWFDQMDQADFLVLLDDVQFAHRSWQQRNRLRGQDGLSFLSVPVLVAGQREQLLASVRLADPRFVHKALGTVRSLYARAPFFDELFLEFESVLRDACSTGSLLSLNCALIDWLARIMRIDTPRVLASELGEGGQRGEHLAALCARVGADRYLSAPGAEAYLLEDRSAFDQRGIQIAIHRYEHPEYPQRYQPFMPYASALDLVFNTGEDAGAILRSGRRASRPLATL